MQHIQVNLSGCQISNPIIEEYRSFAEEQLSDLWGGNNDFTGWIRQPLDIQESELDLIETAAQQVRRKSDYLIVLGIGGSYIGAKSAIDLLRSDSFFETEVLFAGYHFDARSTRELLQKINTKDVSICVISKSGSTAETMAAYGVYRDYLITRYGREEAAERTYVITECRTNKLYDHALNEGIQVFPLAEDIGGRYSVLTAVGLFPAAVAGIDIRKMIKGAAGIASPVWFQGSGLDYAIARQCFYRSGKNIEVFEFFDPYAEFFGEWLKQLFGESEGKEKKGIFPVSLLFSRDLHSMGQFLQQGTDCFFETMITAQQDSCDDLIIPETVFPPFAGKTMQQINDCAVRGVYDAHVKSGIPVIRIEVDRFSPGALGELFYFFETQCAVSALLSGVNPFDQPGVEAYKKEMRSYIKQLG